MAGKAQGESVHRVVKWGLVSAVLCLPLFFQNCSKINFAESGSSLSAAIPVSHEGNGTGYGGKPSGDFYRFDPEFTCEGKEAPVASLSMSSIGINYVENKKLFCGANKMPLPENLVDQSIYQGDIVGYKEGIFEGRATVPSSIPSNLVEVWCRDAADATGIETVTHYNRATFEGVTRIYYTNGSGSAVMIPDFSTPRVAAAKLVTVKDGKGFTLNVYRDRPATQLGLFQGSLVAMIDGKQVSRATSCRLGGSLDPKVWPARQIVDSNMLLFKFAPNLQSFGFTSQTGLASPNLFASDLNGGNQVRVTPPLFAKGVPAFEFTLDSGSLLYWADQKIDYVLELFKVQKNGSGRLQINAPLNATGQSIVTKFELTSDGTRVIYEDGHQSTFTDNEQSLNASSLLGGAPIVLSPPSAGVDFSAGDFALSKSTNRVAFLDGFTHQDFYIANVDGSGLLKPQISYPSPGWSLMFGESIAVPYPGNFAIFKSWKFDTPPAIPTIYTAVAMDSTISTSFPINWDWLYSSPTGNVALMSNNQKSSNLGLINLKTGATIDLPTMKAQGFSKDGSILLGSETNSAGQEQRIAIDVTSGKKSVLCSQTNGQVAILKDFGTGQFLVSAWNPSTGLLNVYIGDFTGQCNLKNSLPTLQPVRGENYLSPDGLSAAVRITVNLQGINHDQLYLIPLNGTIPVQVDAPVYVGATIGNVQFLPDSRSLFYTGDQISTGDQGAFLWRVP